jgi:membrane-associated phospholipid phosphatase
MHAFLYDWGGLNDWLFHLINDVHTPWLDSLMRLGTLLGGHDNFSLYLALAAAIGFVSAARGRGAARLNAAYAWLSVLAVFSIGYALEGGIIGLLKPWLDFPRPPLALPAGSVHVVGQLELHHSLPSGHSAFAMLVVASLWPVAVWPVRAGLALFALWVGLSRISLGAHFPADVLAGFALSLAVVWLLQRIAQSLGQRGLVR